MIDKIFKWIYNTSPGFWDRTFSIAFVVILTISISLIGWEVWTLLHSQLLTAIAIGVPIFLLIWLRSIHMSHAKGIRGWWNERPWKKM